MDYIDALRDEFMRAYQIPAEKLEKAYNAAMTYTKGHYAPELAAYSMVQECLWQMHGRTILSESKFLCRISPDAWVEVKKILTE